MSDPKFKRAFVAGATGYTGQALVPLLSEHPEIGEVVAHIRPGSSKLDSMKPAFEEMGAIVDTTEWDDDAFCDRFEELRPDLVFALLGTTKARKRSADDREAETYHAVDYGLTALLIRACVTAELSAKFVYLSSMGVTESSMSSYIQARWKAENYLQHSELPYLIVRPSFISGPDRDESRPLERVGSVATDAALGVVGALGGSKLRDKYQSMDADELATGMLELALDDHYTNTDVEADVIRRRAQTAN